MKILFINRMLSMCRGGGETFDLEISRHLAQQGCDVSYLSGIPLFSGPKLSAPDWMRTSRTNIEHRTLNIEHRMLGNGDENTECRLQNDEKGESASTDCTDGHRLGKTSNTQERRTKNSTPYHWHTMRTPYFGWFPWDRVRGGWRLRLLDFKCFERVAAEWVLRHESDYDVVQVCELPFFVNYYKRRGGRLPVVLRVTAPNYYDPVGGIEKADAVIASGMSIEYVTKNGRPDVVNIPNSIDPSVFHPEESSFRGEHGISSEKTIFLYVARFQGFKNHPLLVSAFERYKAHGGNGLLVFAGSGPHEQSVKKLAAEKNLMDDILFLGEVGYSALPDVYNASDIQVISSDYESFCFSAIEAMACGKPVITTDNGWVPVLLGGAGENALDHRPETGDLLGSTVDYRKKTIDLLGKTVDNGSKTIDHRHFGKNDRPQAVDHRPQSLKGGLVVPVGDGEALAEAMSLLSRGGAMRRSMGVRNLAFVCEHFIWNRSAMRLNNLYKELLNKQQL